MKPTGGPPSPAPPPTGMPPPAPSSPHSPTDPAIVTISGPLLHPLPPNSPAFTPSHAIGIPPAPIPEDSLAAGLDKVLETAEKPAYTDSGPLNPVEELAQIYVEEALAGPGAPRPHLRLKVGGEMYDVEQRGDMIWIFGPAGDNQKVILQVLKKVKQENAKKNPPMFNPDQLDKFIVSAQKRARLLGFSPNDQLRALALAQQALHESGFVIGLGGAAPGGYEEARSHVDRFFERQKTAIAANRTLHLGNPLPLSPTATALTEDHRKAFTKIIHRIYKRKP